MDVQVNGRRMEVSDELRRLTTEKVTRLARVVDMDRAEVLFSQETNPRISHPVTCEITLEGQGHHVRSKVSDADGFSAVDKAASKVHAQLKRLKSKIHQHGHETVRTAESPLDQPVDAGVLDGDTADGAVPRIVKSKRFAMMPMTPEDAAHRMELLGHGFFFFTSIDTHRAAVVYARDDGDVGLIDEAD